MLLHDAIPEVFRRSGNRPMHADDVAAEVSRVGLYHRKDRQPVPREQLVARMTKERYSHLFERTAPGHYRLA